MPHAEDHAQGTSSAALEPDLPIVDAHHHLWHPHASRYYTDAFQADINASGHRVVATVYVETSAMYRSTGPQHLRPVGEAEFAAGMAAMGESGAFGPTRICAAIVGAADLTLGDRVEDVLDALAQASGGRFRGVRGTANWDADASVNTGTRPFAPEGLLREARYRDGARWLARRGLVYDAWQYFPQLPDVCDLADHCPELTMVVNHCAGLLGIGPYARADNFERWRGLVTEAAKRPNLRMKIGGLAGGRTGFGYPARPAPPTLDEVVADWRPYVETCIDLFGAERCMFESNFPVDKVAGSYGQIWNAFKTLAAGASPGEKRALFAGTAARTYGIGIEA